MTRAERVAPSEIAHDPIVRTALEQHGVTPETADWRMMENGPETGYPAHNGAPNIHIDGKYAYVRWWRADGKTPKYERTAGAEGRRSLRLPGMEVAETLFSALIGGELRRLVDMPGDPGLVIHSIHVENLGEFRDTVIILEEVPCHDGPVRPDTAGL